MAPISLCCVYLRFDGSNWVQNHDIHLVSGIRLFTIYLITACHWVYQSGDSSRPLLLAIYEDIQVSIQDMVKRFCLTQGLNRGPSNCQPYTPRPESYLMLSQKAFKLNICKPHYKAKSTIITLIIDFMSEHQTSQSTQGQTCHWVY